MSNLLKMLIGNISTLLEAYRLRDDMSMWYESEDSHLLNECILGCSNAYPTL